VAGAAGALEDGKTVFMAAPRLAEPEPFFALDPARLSEPPRRGGLDQRRDPVGPRVTLAELSPVDLVVMGCVAAGEDGRTTRQGRRVRRYWSPWPRAAGLIGPHRRLRHHRARNSRSARPGRSADRPRRPLDFIVTPKRVIDCPPDGPRPAVGICWNDLTEGRSRPSAAGAQRELAQKPR